MDFGNYTLGHLVPGRQNYDDRNPDYQLVRDQVSDACTAWATRTLCLAKSIL